MKAYVVLGAMKRDTKQGEDRLGAGQGQAAEVALRQGFPSVGELGFMRCSHPQANSTLSHRSVSSTGRPRSAQEAAVWLLGPLLTHNKLQMLLNHQLQTPFDQAV